MKSGKCGTSLILSIWLGGASLILHGQDSLPGVPLIHTFSPIAYGAGSQNWDLIQDERGFLYVANHYGLLEYDGHVWETYGAIKQGSLKSLCMGQDGRLYVGGQGKFGYFKQDIQQQFSFVALHDRPIIKGLNFDEVWDIYATGDGIFFCCHDYIFRYQPQTDQLTVISYPTYTQYAFLCNYQLYVSSWEDGLAVLQGDSLIPIAGAEVLRHRTIRALLPLTPKKTLIGTQEGDLFTYDGEQFAPFILGEKGYFDDIQINVIIRLRDGRLVVGTQNTGLYIFFESGNLQYHLDKSTGLSSPTIYRILEDQKGNLWVGHNSGLSYVFLGAPFKIIDEKLGVRGPGYAAIKYQDRYFLGTSTGAYVNEANRFTEVLGSSGQVWHFSVQKGQLLMGHHNGAYQYQAPSFRKFGSLQGAWLFQPWESNSNILLQGHYEGIYRHQWDGEAWMPLDSLGRFSESSRLFHQDPTGDIWMSHGFKGVFRISLNEAGNTAKQVRYYDERHGFPSKELINLFKVQNRLVFGTTKGAYVYEPSEDRFIPDPMLLPLLGQSHRLIELVEDLHGNFYYLLDRQLGCLQKNSLGQYDHRFAPFDLIENLISDDLEKVIPLDYNHVLISAREGFINFDPTQAISLQDSIEIYLRKIVSTQLDSAIFVGQAVAAGSVGPKVEFSLPYHQRSFWLRIATNAYDFRDEIKYRFNIESLDSDWTSWSKFPHREINGLRPGRHEMLVQAEVNGKVQTASLGFVTVLNPWYLSGWAKFLYSIIGLGLTALLGWGLWRRFKGLKQALQVDKAQALAHKDKEMEEIAQASQVAIQQAQREKLEAELALKNQELTSSTMHLLAKNAFLQQLKDELDRFGIQLKGGGGNKQQALHRIIHKIDQNLNDEEEWERFSYHFAQVHGDFFEQLKTQYPELTPQELKLCAYLRLNMTTKELAQLLNISIRGVETSRYRLRKKLQLDSHVNLIEFMMKIS